MTLGQMTLESWTLPREGLISAETCWLQIFQRLRDEGFRPEVRVGGKLGHAPAFTTENTPLTNLTVSGS